MIALVVALLCARLLAALLGCVLGLVVGAVGLAVELAYAAVRWVLWPTGVGSWRIVRWLTTGRESTRYAYRDNRPRCGGTPPLRPVRGLAFQAAVLEGVRAARA